MPYHRSAFGWYQGPQAHWILQQADVKASEVSEPRLRWMLVTRCCARAYRACIPFGRAENREEGAHRLTHPQFGRPAAASNSGFTSSGLLFFIHGLSHTSCRLIYLSLHRIALWHLNRPAKLTYSILNHSGEEVSGLAGLCMTRF